MSECFLSEYFFMNVQILDKTGVEAAIEISVKNHF